MTDREKAIVMAYTGYCMLAGDKLSVFYEYVEGIMGRPVYTHEMGTKVVDDLIKEKARPDFIALCADESCLEKPNYTDAEIQKMQDLEFAEIQKAYEIGKAENIEVLDKIRAEIDEQYDRVHPYNISCAEGLEMALEIIDKYKANPTGAEGSE